MISLTRWKSPVCAWGLSLFCGACAAAPAGSAQSPDVALEREDAAAPGEPRSNAFDVAEAKGSAEASSVESGSIERGLEDGRAPDPSRALPELSFRHIGMHIGGESNSAESKRPFFQVIEASTTELLRCYRFVERPLHGGVYGVDLYVNRVGGAPEVRAVRQKLGQEEFTDCMQQVWLGMQFQKRERATVVSYSLRFDIQTASKATEAR